MKLPSFFTLLLAATFQAKLASGQCTGTPFSTKTELSNAVNSYVSENCATDSNCATLSTWGNPIDTWCVGKVTDMSSLFSAKTTFNSDIDSWDISAVTTLSLMFQSASQFSQDLNSWNTSGVTDLYGTFKQAGEFDGDISSWDVSLVTTASEMFYRTGDGRFNKPLDSWNVASVTNMFRMLSGNRWFNQPLNSWNIGSAETLSNMFAGNYRFNQPLYSWNTSSVYDMSSMFAAMLSTGFNQPICSWDVSSVTSFFRMFENSQAFGQNLCAWGAHYDSSHDYFQMFQPTTQCESSETQPSSPTTGWCAATCPADTEAQCDAIIAEASPLVDECALGTDNCHTEATCTDTPESFSCTCNKGFEGDGVTCTPTLEAAWDVSFLDLVANFTAASTEELSLTYEVGKGRTIEWAVYKDCTDKETITDITLEPVDSITDINQTHELLTLKYDINKTEVATSSIWNETLDKIEFCQVVSQVVPAFESTPKLVIATDEREIDIDFDLSVNYTTNTSLAAGDIENADAATAVSSSAEACQCTETDVVCTNEPLAPNSELFVCVKSIDDAIDVDELVSMIISQTGQNPFTVVNEKNVINPAITSLESVSNKAVRVATRVPSNLFNFAAGEVITISGVINMKLVGSGRKLRALVGEATSNIDGDEEAAYELKIDVKGEADLALEDEVPIGNSGSTKAKELVAALGMAALSAYLML